MINMNRKVISLNTIDYSGEHISVSLHGNKATFEIKSTDAMGAAAELIMLYSAKDKAGNYLYDLTKANQIKVKVKNRINLQFLSMYLVAPYKDFDRRVAHESSTNTKPVFEFILSTEAAKELIDVTSNSGRASVMLPQFMYGPNIDLSFSFEDENIERANPEVVTTKQAKQGLLETAENTKNVLTALSKNYQEKWGQYCNDFKVWVNTFVSSNLKESSNLQKTSPTEATKYYSSEQISAWAKDMLDGATFHTPTDRTTIMSINDKALDVIDCGNPATVDLALECIRQKPSIDTIDIDLTHFHFDHTEFAVELIEAALDNGKTVNLNIGDVTTRQFFGWFGSNSDRILPKLLGDNWKSMLAGKVPLSFESNFNINFTKTPFRQPTSIQHFTDVSPVIIENHTANKVIVIFGDYNAQPPKPSEKPKKRLENLKKGLAAYFNKGFDEACKKSKKIGIIEMHHDIGHIKDTPGIGAELEKFIYGLAKEQQEKAATLGFSARYFHDHKKDPNTKGSVGPVSNEVKGNQL